MRKLAITPDDIDNIDKLKLLPKLTKELALTQNKALQVNNIEMRKLFKGRTGGSTGEPLNYFHDKETQAFNRASHYRGLSWANFEWGDPMVCFFGGTLGIGVTSIKELIRSKLTRQYFYPAFEIKSENLKAIQHLIDTVKPKALIGYTSSIFQLCLLLRENGVHFSVPIVFTTGEILVKEQRDLISEVLECKVYDYYGCGEIQGIAYQCPITENYLATRQFERKG